MNLIAGLDCALDELEHFGVRADGFLKDENGHPGVVVQGRGRRAGSNRTFTVDREILETDEEAARSWAVIVASLALEVEA
jgi:hypothetical protein